MLKKIDDRPGPSADESGAALFKSEAEDWLQCVRCGHDVTRAAWAIGIDGDHEHTVFNPAGRLFRVRCFSAAPGVTTTGESTDYFSWFKGYVWCFALCRGCGEHLGWAYSGAAGGRFFGLIGPKLVSRP